MKKRILNISLILSLASTGSVFAQQGFGTNTPHKSAAVEIKSSNKGLLIPRMNLTWSDGRIQAPILGTPAQGLLVYNKTTVANVPEGFYYYSANAWHPIGVSTLQDSSTTTISGTGTANQPYVVEVRNLAGDVTGTVVANKVEKIQNVPVASTGPSNGQVLKADSGTWTPSTLVATDISDPKTLSATKPLNANDGIGAVLKDVTLTIDTATATTLGVVKQGQNTTIVDGAINVATADTNTLGVVKIGSGINVNNGVISVPPAPGETTTYLNFDSSTTNLTYISEDTSTSSLTLNLGDVIRKNQKTTTVVGNGAVNVTPTSANATGNTEYTVSVATADSSTLGVVQIGSGINVNNGVISVTHEADKETSLTQDTATGLVTYKNEVNSSTTAHVVSTATDNVIKYNNGAYLTQGDVQNNQVKYEVVNGNYTNITADTSTANLVKYKVDVTLDGSETKLDTGTNTTLVGNGTVAAPYMVGVNTANGTNLGVVMQGTNTSIVNGAVNVATADTNTLGVVKPGTGITISEDGTLNVLPQADTVTTLTGTKPNGNAIGTYKNEAGTDVVINETITKITYDSSTNVTHVSEDTSTVVFNLGDEVRKNQKTTTVVGNGAVNVTPTSANATGNTEYTVSVDTATATTLGVVKPGTGLTIDSGTLNVDLTTTDIQQLRLDTITNTLTLERGGSVDLSKYLDNTDNQRLSFDTTTNVLSITGDSNTIDFTNYKNKAYTLASDTNTISLLADGTSVDSEIVVKNVALNLSTDNKLTATVNGVANTTALDLSIINTDNQYLTFDTSTFNLGISGDTRTVNLSGLVTKLDTGTNTTLVGNGTVAAPYKVGVNTGNGTSLGVVRQATDNPTVNVTNGELAVNLTNTVLSGEVTGPLNNTIVKDNVIDTANLMDSAVTTTKIVDKAVTTTKIQPATGDTSTSKVLTTNKDGVVEWSTSARPDFFYYPAINIKLDTNTLDLYGIYKNRWENTNMPKSTNTEESSLASLVLPANMIDIYITYYDTNVIDSIQISNQGVMTYTLKPNYSVTDESFMNIVFKVRKNPRP